MQVASTGNLSFDEHLRDRSISDKIHIEISLLSANTRRQRLDNGTVLRKQVVLEMLSDSIAFQELKQSAETQHKESEMFGFQISILTLFYRSVINRRQAKRMKRVLICHLSH